MSKVAAIVLAAGKSERFRAAGGAEVSKLVAPLRGEALVRAAARAALGSRARPVVVVTGHAREAVETALADLPLGFAHNPAFATGLASSLKAGVAALPGDAAGALVLLGDMPAVTPATVERLLEAFEARPDALAILPLTGGRRGNPALVARALFAGISELTGDEGARSLLREVDPSRIVEIEVEGEAAALDVDTPEDLAAARKL